MHQYALTHLNILGTENKEDLVFTLKKFTDVEKKSKRFTKGEML